MKIRSLLALAGLVAAAHTAQAQEVTLKVHFFLPPTSYANTLFIRPGARRSPRSRTTA